MDFHNRRGGGGGLIKALPISTYGDVSKMSFILQKRFIVLLFLFTTPLSYSST